MEKDLFTTLPIKRVKKESGGIVKSLRVKKESGGIVKSLWRDRHCPLSLLCTVLLYAAEGAIEEGGREGHQRQSVSRMQHS